jgi:torulene dioxygenase
LWAAGTLYRTGPGQYNVENTPMGTYHTTHWFDGFGQSHKFEIIPNGTKLGDSVRVEYSSRSQTQELVDIIRKSGQRHNFCFGQRQDPCVGLFSKIMTVWRMPTANHGRMSDNVTVVVQANVPGLPTASKEASPSGDRAGIKTLWLMTDANTMKEVDKKTLEPIGAATQNKLHPLLKGPLSCAHAQRDPETGDFFNYNLEFGQTSTYRIFRTNASTGTTDILATICQANVKPAYIHSFFLSPSYVILCVPSTHLSHMGLKILWDRNIVSSIEPFDESKLRKWFIIDRRENRGVVATYDSPAGFHFHSVNSFEEVDNETGEITVFCDVIEYPTWDVIKSVEMDVILKNNGMTQNFWGDEKRSRNAHSRFARHKFRVPKATTNRKQSRALAPEKVFEIKAPHVGELPTINPNFATRKYRYLYSLPNRGLSTLMDSIAKTDLDTRQTIYWDNPKGHTPGEAIFVPRPRSEDEEEPAEDDGVLLSVVLDGFGKKSYLVCLDASTMKEIGRAECEWAIGLGFHGLHTPA